MIGELGDPSTSLGMTRSKSTCIVRTPRGPRIRNAVLQRGGDPLHCADMIKQKHNDIPHPVCAVFPAVHPPALQGGPDDSVWTDAPPTAIACFRPESSKHRPETTLRLLHDERSLYGLFEVRDRYVRSVVTAFMGPVCTDSCVEFFVAPGPDTGYMNFEFNAGGTLHVSHIRDARREPSRNGFADWRPLTREEGERVAIATSLPPVIEPEREGPLDWWLAFGIPFSLLQDVTGTPGPRNSPPWRANFYKCGDRTSHPHWASWAPLPERNFHRPDDFGILRFAGLNGDHA